ncbi:MAG: sulfatase-like hydrolase/transferase [Phycisphaeraceae bacterium]|nr:sulfatase-like hydrolase/transferase [Phycisphaeraceae bacterium]
MPQSDDRPNIILIMTDQQRYDTIAALGAGHMHTPNLDRLVHEGVALTHCYCTAPSCVPSRSSFFNGRYPHQLGVFHNAHHWSTSWIEQLQASGYHTVNVGKMHTIPFDAPCGFDQRLVVENKDRPLRLEREHGGYFDEWDKYLAYMNVRKPSRDTYKAEHSEWAQALGAFTWPLDEQHHSDIFVGRTARWLIENRRSNAPLLLVIGFPGPHPPYDPPQRFLDLYDPADTPVPRVTDEELDAQPHALKALRQEMADNNHDAVKWQLNPTEAQLRRLRHHYDANVSLIDEHVGLILDALKKRGYLDNAVVVFGSDHGDCLGDHGHIQKWTMYEQITRLPMIFWSPAPGRLPSGAKGKTYEGLTQHIDVAATILEMAGVELDENFEGRSLLKRMQDDAPLREYVFAEHTADNLLKEVTMMTMVRSERYKMVHYEDSTDGELYDLYADPQEKHNRWHDAACDPMKRELMDAMRRWRAGEHV